MVAESLVSLRSYGGSVTEPNAGYADCRTGTIRYAADSSAPQHYLAHEWAHILSGCPTGMLPTGQQSDHLGWSEAGGWNEWIARVDACVDAAGAAGEQK